MNAVALIAKTSGTARNRHAARLAPSALRTCRPTSNVTPVASRSTAKFTIRGAPSPPSRYATVYSQLPFIGITAKTCWVTSNGQ